MSVSKESPGADSERSVALTRLEKGRYEAVNARGGTLRLGIGDTSEEFSPVELLLVGDRRVQRDRRRLDHRQARRADPASR